MGKKKDISQLEAVARLKGMNDLQRRAFGDYIEECKAAGDKGTLPRGDFTWSELLIKADEFLED